ncbi:hypothetical protein QGP82_15775 [Leptothoe sp. LEGE 181152]|nr:hypothetical protein [Leptothoe sp. LEGE 181152]
MLHEIQHSQAQAWWVSQFAAKSLNLQNACFLGCGGSSCPDVGLAVSEWLTTQWWQMLRGSRVSFYLKGIVAPLTSQPLAGFEFKLGDYTSHPDGYFLESGVLTTL